MQPRGRRDGRDRDRRCPSGAGPLTASPFPERLEALHAREEIAELLLRRGRAADAKDPDAILAEHVPGSRDEHGLFDGTIEAFVEHLRTHNYADATYGLQRHTIGNVLIDFESPDAARVEALHLAYHRLHLEDGDYDVHIGGRYLDRCVRHEGRWRLGSRTVVYDWSRATRDPNPPEPT